MRYLSKVSPVKTLFEILRMEIAERTVSEVTVLDLKGKMTLGEGDELLKDKINSLLSQGKKNLC